MRGKKILFTADMHLGCQQYGIKERTEDFYVATERVFDCAINNEEIGAIIIGGDAFDMAKPPAEAVKRLQNAVTKAKEAGIDVYGVDGNHDLAEGKWLTVCGINILSTEPTDICGLKVVGIPSCRYQVFYDHLDNMISDNVNADVLVMHDAIAELSDFRGTDLTGLEVASKLKPLGVKMVLLGHIHKTNAQNINGVEFIYSGSTECKSIDEEMNKSYVVLDANSMKWERQFFRTRIINIVYIKTAEDVGNFVPNTDALNVVFVDGGIENGAASIEKICRSHSALARIVNYKSNDTNVKVASFERDSAINTLSDAVEAYFDKGSKEFELVVKMLETPSNLKQIVEEFIKNNK
jgi:DNA repair exonuclease SbcCD nuclease subunit